MASLLPSGAEEGEAGNEEINGVACGCGVLACKAPALDGAEVPVASGTCGDIPTAVVLLPQPEISSAERKTVKGIFFRQR
ncbi:hypothetical protein D3C80_2053620 [compost metagenome]